MDQNQAAIECRCGHDDRQHSELRYSEVFRARIALCGASQFCRCLRFAPNEKEVQS